MIVGRLRELEGLNAALERARLGSGEIVLIGGEAGVGKSHLLAELFVAAQASGSGIAVGRCFADGGQRAFAPWQQAFEEAAPWGARESQPSLGAADDRARAFEGVLSAVAARARERPLVVAIEDLHWADRDSLLLLLHVARFGLQNPVLLVGTVRAPDLDAARHQALDEVLAELSREHRSATVTLRPFAENDVAEYASALARGDVPQSIAHALHAETGGNPLYVRELVRHLLEEHKLAVREGRLATDFAASELGLPPSIKHIVRHRVARLSEPTVTLLRYAAAGARPSEFALLAGATGLAPEQALDALDEALSSGLLRQAAGGYELTHAIVRRAIVEDLNAERRARVHRRLAEVLATMPEADRAAIATHYHASRELPGREAGVAYAVAAAEAARATGAPERAAALFAMAVDLAPPALVGSLAARLAVAHAAALDVENALAAVALAERTTSLEGDAVAELLVEVARALEQGGAAPSAWEPLVARGLAKIGDRRDVVWARLALFARGPKAVLEGPAWVSLFPGFDPEATRILREQGTVLDFAATVEPHDFRTPAETDELAARARTWKEPAAAIRVLDACARDLFFQRSDFRGAGAQMHDLLSLASAVGSMAGKVAALVVLGCCHAVLGDAAAARDELAQAKGISNRIGAMHRMNLIGPLACETVLAYLYGGDLRAVVAPLLDFVSSPRAAWTPFGLVALNLALLGAALEGDVATSEHLFPLHARALASMPENVNEWGAARDSGAVAAWHLGRRDWAATYLAFAEKSLGRPRCACFGSAELSAARMASLLGDLPRAQRWFDAARADFEKDGRKPLLALCDYDEALTLFRQSGADRGRVLALLDAAKRQFRALGMELWLDRVEPLERAPTEPKPALPDGLTAREAEVLRLLAQGLANKAIAAKLFVSVPTVERHVANIYAKIGGHGRAAATAYALRKGLLPG